MARTKPVSVANPQTEAQQSQRSKFRIINEAARYFAAIIAVGYSQLTTSMTAFNAFMKYNVRTAVNGNYPDLSLNLLSLQVSRGSALPFGEVSDDPSPPGSISFILENPAGSQIPSDSEVYLAIVNSQTNKPVYFASVPFGTGTVLFENTGTLKTEGNHVGYLFYKNSLSGAVSDSMALDWM